MLKCFVNFILAEHVSKFEFELNCLVVVLKMEITQICPALTTLVLP